jgi:hypothetical protein
MKGWICGANLRADEHKIEGAAKSAPGRCNLEPVNSFFAGTDATKSLRRSALKPGDGLADQASSIKHQAS